jgi:hypothetical protein
MQTRPRRGAGTPYRGAEGANGHLRGTALYLEITPEIQPVLDAVGKNAARLCDANNAVIFRLEDGFLRLVASYGGIPTTSRAREGIPADPDTVIARAACDRRTIHVHDLAAEDSEYPVGSRHAKREGHDHACDAVAMRG